MAPCAPRIAPHGMLPPSGILYTRTHEPRLDYRESNETWDTKYCLMYMLSIPSCRPDRYQAKTQRKLDTDKMKLPGLFWLPPGGPRFSTYAWKQSLPWISETQNKSNYCLSHPARVLIALVKGKDPPPPTPTILKLAEIVRGMPLSPMIIQPSRKLLRHRALATGQLHREEART